MNLTNQAKQLSDEAARAYAQMIEDTLDRIQNMNGDGTPERIRSTLAKLLPENGAIKAAIKHSDQILGPKNVFLTLTNKWAHAESCDLGVSTAHPGDKNATDGRVWPSKLRNTAGCGANAEGGGGFQPGNSCGKDDDGIVTTPTGMKLRGVPKGRTTPVHIYHTYDSKRGEFDAAKLDFARGVFGITEHIGYDPLDPNEYGDKVVKIELAPNAKVFTADEQHEAIKKLFDTKEADALIDKWDNADGRAQINEVDAAIGKAATQQGYTVLHYTNTEQYGDEWALLDKSAIQPAGKVKVSGLPPKQLNKLADKMFELERKRHDISQGSSGRHWNAIDTIETNIENALAQHGVTPMIKGVGEMEDAKQELRKIGYRRAAARGEWDLDKWRPISNSRLSNAADPDTEADEMSEYLDLLAQTLAGELAPLRDRLLSIAQIADPEEQLQALVEMRDELPEMLKTANEQDGTADRLEEILSGEFFDGMYEASGAVKDKETNYGLFLAGAAAAVAAGTLLSHYSKEEIAQIGEDIEKRADAVAKVVKAELIGAVDNHISGRFRGGRRPGAWAAAITYDPEAEHDITDNPVLRLHAQLSSAMSNGFGKWKANRVYSYMEQYPVLELVRKEFRKERRDWPAVWAEAGGEFYPGGGDYEAGRMIAPVGDQIWYDISRWGDPFEPFDYGSGMGTEPVERNEAIAIGAWKDDDEPEVVPDRDLNDDVAFSPDLSDGLMEQLQVDLGDGFSVDAGELVMNSKALKSALIVVDVQKDFIDGSLAVPKGEEVVERINKLMPHHDIVVATQDWHPPEHGSFAANHPGKNVFDQAELGGLPQTLWPTHTVQGTPGAEFHPALDTSKITKVFQKGTDPAIDSYSGFFDNGHKKSTGMGEWLKEQGVTDVYVAGLATDYCVKATAIDAAAMGFKTHFVAGASRGVNITPTDVDNAVAEMKKAGVDVEATGENCGTGAGGFKPGNTCGKLKNSGTSDGAKKGWQSRLHGMLPDDSKPFQYGDCNLECYALAKRAIAAGVSDFTIVDGMVKAANGKVYPHTWIEHRGQVVDPTRSQFSGAVEYAPDGEYNEPKSAKDYVRDFESEQGADSIKYARPVKVSNKKCGESGTADGNVCHLGESPRLTGQPPEDLTVFKIEKTLKAPPKDVVRADNWTDYDDDGDVAASTRSAEKFMKAWRKDVTSTSLPPEAVEQLERGTYTQALSIDGGWFCQKPKGTWVSVSEYDGMDEQDASKTLAGSVAGRAGRLGTQSENVARAILDDITTHGRWIKHPMGKRGMGESAVEDMQHGGGPAAKAHVVATLSKTSQLSAEGAQRFLDEWAATSNDHNPFSLVVQKAATQVFGSEMSKWQATRYSKTVKPEYEETNLGVAKRFLKASYDLTQDMLKRAGVKDVVVYRGVKGIKFPKAGKAVRVKGNALESWSLSRGTAEQFGSRVIAMKVPASRIVSTPATGPGCLHEQEIVIVGNRHGDKVRVVI